MANFDDDEEGQESDKVTRSRRLRGPGHSFTPEERKNVQDNFLKFFARSGNIRQACWTVGVPRQTIYRWRNEDDDFEDRYQQALDDVNDRIRAEIWRRAINGVKKPVYQGGKLVGHIQEYSDSLLSLLARAHMPEFRQESASSGEGKREYVGVPVEEV